MTRLQIMSAAILVTLLGGAAPALACEPGFIAVEGLGRFNVADIRTDGHGQYVSVSQNGVWHDVYIEVQGRCNAAVVGQNGAFGNANITMEGSNLGVGVLQEGSGLVDIDVGGTDTGIAVFQGGGGTVRIDSQGTGSMIHVSTNAR